MGLVLSGSPMKSVVIDHLYGGLDRTGNKFAVIYYDEYVGTIRTEGSATYGVNPKETSVVDLCCNILNILKDAIAELKLVDRPLDWVIIYTNLSREEVSMIQDALDISDDLFVQSIITCK